MNTRRFETLLLDLKDEYEPRIVAVMDNMAQDVHNAGLGASDIYRTLDDTWEWRFCAYTKADSSVVYAAFEIEELRSSDVDLGQPSIDFSIYSYDSQGQLLGLAQLPGRWVDIRDSEAVGTRFNRFVSPELKDQRSRVVDSIVEYFWPLPEVEAVLTERQTTLFSS